MKAKECQALVLCEYFVENGEARQKVEKLAHQIARFPQTCVQADRKSVFAQEKKKNGLVGKKHYQKRG